MVKSIFYHIMQICISNSMIIFREVTGKKIEHKDFLESIIRELLGKPNEKTIKK